MAKVFVQAIGGEVQEKNYSTVAEIKKDMDLPNHQAMVQGEPEDDSYELQDYDVVTLAPKVKGA